MLLQIQVYPATEIINNTNVTQPQSPQQSIEPLVTHYINTSIPVTNTSNDSTASSSKGKTTELLWSVGRKQGDYHITTDRSVSREHLRILKLQGILNSNNDDHGSIENVLLQIQNVGKLGSSLVIEESFMDDDDDDGDKDGNIVNKNDDNGNDSDTTVDESLLSHHINVGSSKNTNLNLGSHINRSQNQRASQQSIMEDVDLSSITKHLTQRALINITTTPRRNYNVRLQSLGLNETLTVGFYGESSSSNINNGASSMTTMCDYHHPNRIVVQCGKLGTTIVITRVQLRFVASRIPMKQFLMKMKSDIVTVVGGSIEETLYHPNENNNEDYETNRTYLISSEYHGSPKHIIAWCRNIPIVQPSFVASLIDEYRNKLFKSSHVCTNDASPVPSMGLIQQHALPVPKKDWKFFEGTHNAELWKRCTLISPLSDTDPTDGDSASGSSNINIQYRNEKELNELVQAAGATVITIQSLLKENDNLLRQVAVLDYNSINGSTIRHLLDVAFVDHPTTTSYFTLDTPIMKSQYPMALKTLQDIYGIPTLTTKEVAVAITEQRNIHDQICSFHKIHTKPKTGQKNNVQEPFSTSTLDKSTTTESNKMETSIENDDVSDTRSRKQRVVQPASTRSKRTRGGASITTQDVDDSHRTTVSKTRIRQDLDERNATEPRVTSTRRRRQPMAPNDVSLNENANEPDESFMVNCDDALPEDTVVQDLDSPPTKMVESETVKSKAVISNVGQMDGNNGGEHSRRNQVTDNTEGWFTAMPQGPTRKSVYNEKVKKLTLANKAEDVDDNDGEKITCSEPAMTQTLKGMVVKPKDASTHFHRVQHAGPNYKAFRKNTVHLPTIVTVVGLKPCRPTKTRKVVSIDDDEQRSQVEAQQRRADELFR